MVSKTEKSDVHCVEYLEMYWSDEHQRAFQNSIGILMVLIESAA